MKRNNKRVNCQPKSRILMFLACGAHPSCDTLIFRGESSYYYVETCVLNIFLCLGYPVISTKWSTLLVAESHFLRIC